MCETQEHYRRVNYQPAFKSVQISDLRYAPFDLPFGGADQRIPSPRKTPVMFPYTSTTTHAAHSISNATNVSTFAIHYTAAQRSATKTSTYFSYGATAPAADDQVSCGPAAAPKEISPFLKTVNQIIEEQIDNPRLGIEQLCAATHCSHTQLFRRMKALTGENPTGYLRSMRLQKALELLQKSDLNVSEIAYDLGFTDPNYFSRVFRKKYGTPPSNVRTSS